MVGLLPDSRFERLRGAFCSGVVGKVFLGLFFGGGIDSLDALSSAGGCWAGCDSGGGGAGAAVVDGFALLERVRLKLKPSSSSS